MENLVKFMYCLNLGSDDYGERVKYFAMFTSLTDKRSLGSRKERFRVGPIDGGAEEHLLKYILNKDEYKAKAKTRFEKIAKHIGQKSSWIDD